jgi:hypothetical protein
MEKPMTSDPSLQIAEKLTAIDHGQNALLENGHSVQDQLETMMGLLTHLIQILTTKPEHKGPTLDELLAQILGQLKENNKIQSLNYEILLLLEEKALQVQPKEVQC